MTTRQRATLVDHLETALGPDVVARGDRLPERRFHDWSGLPGTPPLVLLRPRTTDEVATALRLCHAARQSVVPQGGLTGLAGGANLRHAGEIALSLERMTALQLDSVGGTLTAEGGVSLQAVQEAAEAAGHWFPLDLGARGSCTIGGNLATNAGGNRVLRYGMARDQVLDLEAVLADGSVIGGRRAMLKNNTGYDLRHLLIGSEGTLGVITSATLRLRARPTATATAWCGVPDYEAVTHLLREGGRRLSNGVSAFEVMWPDYLRFVMDNVAGLRRPLASEPGFHVLLESLGSNAAQHQEEFERFLADLLDQGVITDAAIARSEADARQFWEVREATVGFPALMPRLLGFDVSFALADIADAAQACARWLKHNWPGSTLLVYGHLGDGNLHVIIDVPGATDGTLRDVELGVYGLVRDYGGSVSAEHGVGTKKRDVLGHSRSLAELAAMQAIKHALDPRGILNPGKLLD
ncbi:MAG: FAD-binding oxidoreductase [Pigmentiphaga sp.]